MVSSSSPLSGMDTNVYFLSAVAMPVACFARRYPAQPRTSLGWSFCSALSSSMTFFDHAGSSTVLPSGALKIATMWPVRSRPYTLSPRIDAFTDWLPSS